jgi:LPXTG-motif cell wall-anchored protein
MARIKTLLVIGGAALAVAALPAPAQACHSGCTSSGNTSTGGTNVPAPAAFGLFALSALGLAAKRRRARG